MIKPESKGSKKSTKIKEGTGKGMRMDGEQGKSPKKTGGAQRYVEELLKGDKPRVKRKYKEHEN